MRAIITFSGNGFPAAGDYVSHGDGLVFQVSRVYGPLHPSVSDAGRYACADVEIGDWSDVDADAVWSVSLSLRETDEDEREWDDPMMGGADRFEG